MDYVRMPLEVESPEELGYGTIRYNLSESSIADRALAELDADLSKLVLFYGPHRGDDTLRALIAAQSGSPLIGPADVLTTGGAAGALFIVATSLLRQDSHLVVVRPNYATNIETPRAIGCQISYVDLKFEEAFRLDVARIEAALRPNTAYLSITCPHNPSGTLMPWEDLERLGQVAERAGCYVLVDETYRDLAFTAPYPTAASISPRFIGVSSVSKAYGIPGVRVGWLITRAADLQQRFLAAKEQIGICGSVVDEALALAALRQRAPWLQRIAASNRERLGIVRRWLAQERRVEWVEPAGGVVCFPRLKVPGHFDTGRFYRSLLDTHGTYVGQGHWFEMPDTYLRIGFGWPTLAELQGGLAGISAALSEQVPGP
jgi:aspartate/methionine/tyrosine aminotransferase